MIKILLVFLVFAVSPVFAWNAEVKRVVDGDTIRVIRQGIPQNKKEIIIRLDGIDAPEKTQMFGNQARIELEHLILGKVVDVQDKGTDKYGRTIGRVTYKLTDTSVHMVSNGLAFWYYKYSPGDLGLEAAEIRARRNKIGVWSVNSFEKPWDYRVRRK